MHSLLSRYLLHRPHIPKLLSSTLHLSLFNFAHSHLPSSTAYRNKSHSIQVHSWKPFSTFNIRTFYTSTALLSWRHPKPASALRRLRFGKKKRYKMKPLRSLEQRFFLDREVGLLKYRSAGLKHYNWKKSCKKYRRMKGWHYCTKRQTRKYLRFMNVK